MIEAILATQLITYGGVMNSIGKGFPNNLRPADVIAKTARVTLKDTVRVLVALDAVLEEAGVSFESFMVAYWGKFTFEQATPENAEACEQFYTTAMSGENGAIYDRKLYEFTSERQRQRLAMPKLISNSPPMRLQRSCGMGSLPSELSNV